MIFVVDDDPDLLALVRGVLGKAGYAVETFADAESALERLREAEPELILSDVRMPGRDGFGFKQEVARRLPNRSIPFLFLSSQDDPDSIVRGLDLGADDYLTKPIHPEVLRAKVRSVLARARRAHLALFEGDLARFPFMQVLQFCEARGISGVIQVEVDRPADAGGALRVTIGVERGEVVFDEVADTYLDVLMGLREGIFRIQVPQVDFEEILHASWVPPTPEPELAAGEQPETFHKPLPLEERPMGHLSGVRLGNRLFQVQTEYATPTGPAAPSSGGGGQIVTVVLLDGRTVLKRANPAREDGGRDAVARAMREQHAAVEAEVREKLQSLGGAGRAGAGEAETPAIPPNERESGPPSPTSEGTQHAGAAADTEDPQAAFNRLFETGVDAYVAGRYAEAIAAWEQAAQIDPDNKTVAVNLDIARKKLAAARP